MGAGAGRIGFFLMVLNSNSIQKERFEVEQHSVGGAYAGDTLAVGAPVKNTGGTPLRTLHLDDTAFDESAMQAGGGLPFHRMKLAQLKEELAVRGSARSGLKATLQRRLHSLLVEAVVTKHTAEFQFEDVESETEHEAMLQAAASKRARSS